MRNTGPRPRSHGGRPHSVRAGSSCGSDWRIRASSSSRRDRAPAHHDTRLPESGNAVRDLDDSVAFPISFPANSSNPRHAAGYAERVCMSRTPGCPCAAVSLIVTNFYALSMHSPHTANGRLPPTHAGQDGALQANPWGNGAGSRSRTRDLLITNQLLYQLSYAGEGRRF